jgi:hypothetical protein
MSAKNNKKKKILPASRGILNLSDKSLQDTLLLTPATIVIIFF